MFEKLKNLFKKPEEKPVLKKEPATPKQQKPATPELTEKEKATAAGEPYVNIIKMEIDPKDINSGYVDLDFNDKFVLNLIRAGYKMKDTDTDNDIVDRWWTNLCRATVLETFEQEIADPDKRAPGDVRNVVTRDLGNGRTEVS
jgi:hypothetical protein